VLLMILSMIFQGANIVLIDIYCEESWHLLLGKVRAQGDIS
jgi:hypothetical protein